MIQLICSPASGNIVSSNLVVASLSQLNLIMVYDYQSEAWGSFRIFQYNLYWVMVNCNIRISRTLCCILRSRAIEILFIFGLGSEGKEFVPANWLSIFHFFLLIFGRGCGSQVLLHYFLPILYLLVLAFLRLIFCLFLTVTCLMPLFFSF